LIRAVVKRGILEFGHEFIGIENGYMGLYEPDLAVPLTLENTRGILTKGGTVLGTSNKANPSQYAVRENGRLVEKDVSARIFQRFNELGLDGLIAVGGDGTLSSAYRLSQLGMNVVGCPKTIDNDLTGTELTFGFDTARAICTDAVDRLHTTAESHERVMVLEVMGRHAGFIAYRIDSVVQKVKGRQGPKRSFSIIVVSEGAHPQGGEVSVVSEAHETPGRGVVRLGGAGKVAADLLASRIEVEIRVTVLGHLQRGGPPSAADRLLATRYGFHVLDLVAQQRWGEMVSFRRGEIGSAHLSESTKTRRVDPQGELVRVAKSLGTSFGDA
jgi:6-phosphofructokinase 1